MTDTLPHTPVRTIINDLSDGMSELVLLVVVLADQDADVPASLPRATGLLIFSQKYRLFGALSSGPIV